MQSLFARIIPFIFLGIMIVLLVAGVIILSYLLIAGAIIGLILFAVAWVRDRFFNHKPNSTMPKKGRTLDHRDL